jgi:predicted dehydrogenase
MKKIKVALLGCGNRGKIYADYSLRYPEQMEVVAVIDQNNFKLEQAKKRYSITSDMAFSSLDEFISKKIP